MVNPLQPKRSSSYILMDCGCTGSLWNSVWAIMPIELQHHWDGFNKASGLIGCYNKLLVSIRYIQ